MSRIPQDVRITNPQGVPHATRRPLLNLSVCRFGTTRLIVCFCHVPLHTGSMFKKDKYACDKGCSFAFKEFTSDPVCGSKAIQGKSCGILFFGLVLPVKPACQAKLSWCVDGRLRWLTGLERDIERKPQPAAAAAETQASTTLLQFVVEDDWLFLWLFLCRFWFTGSVKSRAQALASPLSWWCTSPNPQSIPSLGSTALCYFAACTSYFLIGFGDPLGPRFPLFWRWRRRVIVCSLSP